MVLRRSSDTHQLIEHDKQTDAGEIHRILCSSYHQLAYTLRLQSRPPSAAANSIRQGAGGERQRTIYDSNVGKSLRSNVIEPATYFRLQAGL